MPPAQKVTHKSTVLAGIITIAILGIMISSAKALEQKQLPATQKMSSRIAANSQSVANNTGDPSPSSTVSQTSSSSTPSSSTSPTSTNSSTSTTSSGSPITSTGATSTGGTTTTSGGGTTSTSGGSTPSTGSGGTTTATYTYKNGTYSVVGSYLIPGNHTEHVGVQLTISNDVITDATVTNMSDNPTSNQYQNDFIGGYKSYVIGKALTSLSLSKVSGASLTPQGFNDGTSQIRTKAS